MNSEESTKIEMIKLTGGVRLLRVTDSESGLCVEKKLDVTSPVVSQKQDLVRALKAAALAQASLPVA